MSDSEVHVAHCCATHGCKYGEDDTCPVTQHMEAQDYPCEYCEEMKVLDLIEEGFRVVAGLKHPDDRAAKATYVKALRENLAHMLVRVTVERLEGHPLPPITFQEKNGDGYERR